MAIKLRHIGEILKRSSASSRKKPRIKIKTRNREKKSPEKKPSKKLE